MLPILFHGPREGSDAAAMNMMAIPAMFQSTPP